jgi:hypothetical protein
LPTRGWLENALSVFSKLFIFPGAYIFTDTMLESSHRLDIHCATSSLSQIALEDTRTLSWTSRKSVSLLRGSDARLCVPVELSWTCKETIKAEVIRNGEKGSVTHSGIFKGLRRTGLEYIISRCTSRTYPLTPHRSHSRPCTTPFPFHSIDSATCLHYRQPLDQIGLSRSPVPRHRDQRNPRRLRWLVGIHSKRLRLWYCTQTSHTTRAGRGIDII